MRNCLLLGPYSRPMTRGSTVAYLRLIDSCITQLKAQGPSRTCDESKEEEEDNDDSVLECGRSGGVDYSEFEEAFSELFLGKSKAHPGHWTHKVWGRVEDFSTGASTVDYEPLIKSQLASTQLT